MKERHDVVLGAGLAGLTAAHTFAQAGEDHWQVYEREDRVGGHARSIVVDDYVFDLGPHILFTNDPDMEALIRDLLGDNLRAQSRRAYIYHHAHRTYTRFPFQAHLYGLPVELVKECLLELVRAVERQALGQFAPANYEDWMRGFFGHAIAERLMIPYARKIWTVEPSIMDFNWIGRRVPTPDVERILAGALTDDVAQVGATASFWYPWSGGAEALPRALGQRVGGIRLERTVERIELPAKAVVFADGERIQFEHLISSLPLSALPSLVTNMPPAVERACRGLRYQGVYNVNLGIDAETVSDKHWIYFYEDPFPFHRISFPGNFSPQNVPPRKSSISTEVAFSSDRPLEEERLLERTIEALVEAELLPDRDAVELVHAETIVPAYVIYDLEHGRNVEVIRSWLREHGILSVGRFGEWQYFNMDHSMRSGKAAAEAILARR